MKKKIAIVPEKLPEGAVPIIGLLRFKVMMKKAYDRHGTSKHRPGRRPFMKNEIRAKRKLERQNKKKGRQ